MESPIAVLRAGKRAFAPGGYLIYADSSGMGTANMTTPINPQLLATFDPPIMAARRWLDETPPPPGLPLIDLSQAAPREAPVESLRRAMAEALLSAPDAHFYGPVLGNTDLRQQIAADWSRDYAGRIEADQVAVTAGCNQAFCTAIASLCAPGDAVLLPAPWYFNHKMWLDMNGIEAIPLAVGPDMLPDPAEARALMTPRVRAIALITPNNPTGAEYPDALMHAFFDLAESHGAGLVVDETYRDFHSAPGAPHTLFQRPGWEEVFIHLYSFSKIFRLTGHRVGAMITGARRIAEMEKILDTVTICPAQTGQIAALHGLRHLGDWVAGERAEILSRREVLGDLFARELPDWQVKGAGAYFAYVAPPWPIPSDALAIRLIGETGLLMLPGTMFTPDDPAFGGAGHLRVAFANIDAEGLAETVRRLAAFRP